MSHEKFTDENPGEEYGYDQADNYREENGPMNAPPLRGNPQGAYQRPNYRPRMSNPQGGYQTGPSGYSSRRYHYHMDDNIYPGAYGNARGYGSVRRDYPNYYHQNHYRDGYYDNRHHGYHGQDYRDHGYHGYRHHGYRHNDYCHNDYCHYDHHDCHYDYGPYKGRGWFDPDFLYSMMRNPRTNNFFRGVGMATIGILLAPPIARALKPLAVQAVHGVTSIVDELKGVVSDAREDIEDIFADGNWGNMEHDGTVKQPPSENQ